MDHGEPQTFSRDERLKHSGDFRRCIRRGGKAVGRFVVVYALPNVLGRRRLGAGTTKRLGNAVKRNRAKRLVREAFRLRKGDLPQDVDLVVLPKIPWREPALEELKDDLVETARRAAGKMAASE